MKRWDVTSMLDIGRKLFAKIYKQKKHASPNHDVHFLAREIDGWLPKGIQTLIDGTYDPRCLKRIYLKPLDDAMSKMNITYLRFQDDWLILCKTKRQMQHYASRRRLTPPLLRPHKFLQV